MSTAVASADLEARQALALDAADEIEALVGILTREKERQALEFERIVLPTFLRRIAAVNSVIVSVLGGDVDRKTEEMRCVLHGDESGEVTHA